MSPTLNSWGRLPKYVHFFIFWKSSPGMLVMVPFLNGVNTILVVSMNSYLENHLKIIQWHRHHIGAFAPCPDFDGDPFANSKIYLAFKFTASIWLELFSKLNSNCFALWSMMKSWVALVSTIALLSLMSTYIGDLPTFKFFCFVGSSLDPTTHLIDPLLSFKVLINHYCYCWIQNYSS